jgi:hypothetical protein
VREPLTAKIGLLPEARTHSGPFLSQVTTECTVGAYSLTSYWACVKIRVSRLVFGFMSQELSFPAKSGAAEMKQVQHSFQVAGCAGLIPGQVEPV